MYRSFLGSLLSVATLALIITYGVYKAIEVFSKQDYKVQKRQLFEFYDSDEKFGAKDGFMVAANIFSYEKEESLRDPAIGELKIVQSFYVD